MIFIHELGHHLMAKYLGIRVDVFSLGFGPRLFGFRMGETDYRVSLLPLGGFVKMRGENYDEDLSGNEEEFLSRPKSHRFAVAIAGPAMNIFLAIVLIAVNYMIGIQVPAHLSQPAVVGYIVSDSPAAEAGIEIGDRVQTVDEVVTPTWEAVQIAIATNPGRTIPVTIERGGTTFERLVTVKEDDRTGAGDIGILPPVFSTITSVVPGPAEEAGLKPGDIIVKARKGDIVLEDLPQILDLIASSQGEPVDFTLQRQDETFEASITPVDIEGKARLGISIAQLTSGETTTEHYGLFAAIAKATERNVQLTGLTFRIIGKLLTGETSIKMMSGPIEIAKFSGQAASAGFQTLVAFMALISLQLGIFNLMPIPILDGGVIALLGIEALMGRDLSLQVKERIFQVGFIFLILLMSIVIFNDISKNI
ncbi:MAG: RIP metalloprotease RseP [Acidobacteriota bacterium]|nr:MAG: RIP metalloprotease RseP [Acidobacteriota bacterium]